VSRECPSWSSCNGGSCCHLKFSKTQLTADEVLRPVTCGGASPIPEKRVGHSLKDLGPSQKTLRRPWCPKVVMDLEVLPHIPFAMKNWPQEYKKMHIKLSWVRTFSSPSSKQPFHMKMPLVRFLFPTARLQSDVEGCFSLFFAASCNYRLCCDRHSST